MDMPSRAAPAAHAPSPLHFEVTPIFDKDVKKLDAHERKELKDLLDKILERPELGKPMGHHANIFSKRIDPRRLVYAIQKQEGKIILLLYKNRYEVYDALRKMNL